MADIREAKWRQSQLPPRDVPRVAPSRKQTPQIQIRRGTSAAEDSGVGWQSVVDPRQESAELESVQLPLRQSDNDYASALCLVLRNKQTKKKLRDFFFLSCENNYTGEALTFPENVTKNLNGSCRKTFDCSFRLSSHNFFFFFSACPTPAWQECGNITVFTFGSSAAWGWRQWEEVSFWIKIEICHNRFFFFFFLNSQDLSLLYISLCVGLPVNVSVSMWCSLFG